MILSEFGKESCATFRTVMKTTKNNFSRFALSALAAACLLQPVSAQDLNIETTPPKREGAHAGYAPIVDKVMPSIVSITSKKAVRQVRNGFVDPRRGMIRPFGLDPRLFGYPQGEDPNEEQVVPQGTGSGVIISQDGYIVTNNHVIDDSDAIDVVLNGSNKTYEATVVGTDPSTDLAVLKIEADDLPAVTIGSSSQMKPGDFVLAMGSPFGLPNTVTQGIVSAIGRTDLQIINNNRRRLNMQDQALMTGGYEDFIQTDASINPGNSGGALVDNQGRVIGINTAIYSRSGGANGIGFAIPSDLVINVAKQLITNGKVSRGYVGIMMSDLKPEIAKALNFKGQGVLVQEVRPDSPAEEAGLRGGDIIVSYNDRDVRDDQRFRLAVSSTAPGEKRAIKVFRDGKTKDLEITIGSIENGKIVTQSSGWGSNKFKELIDGLGTSDLFDASVRQKYNVPKDISGIVVTKVDPKSTAAKAGLRVGEVITEVNQRPISGNEEAMNLRIEAEKSGAEALLLRVLSPQGGARYLGIELNK